MSKTNLTPANAYTYGGNLAMSLPDNPICTAEDYWNLPEGERAELIDGQLYALASPSRIHQEIIIELTYHFQHYIKSNKGNCKIYAAPFAVNLNANDQAAVEWTISGKWHFMPMPVSGNTGSLILLPNRRHSTDLKKQMHLPLFPLIRTSRLASIKICKSISQTYSNKQHSSF